MSTRTITLGSSAISGTKAVLIFHACEGEMSITAQRRAERNANEARRQARLAELDREERNRAARERRAAKKAAAERERELSKR